MPDRTPCIRFVPAARLSLEAYADVFTRSFTGYFYPIKMTASGLAARVRIEHIDLYRSLVLMKDNLPAGQATLALQGDRAWCGGFGIVPEFRGQGLAVPLFSAMKVQALDAGARILELEVLKDNTAAHHVYGGMHKVRETRLLEWRSSSARNGRGMDNAGTIKPANMWDIVPVFKGLHPVPPVWARDLHCLLLRPGLLQLDDRHAGALQGYLLFTAKDDNARIYDLAAMDMDIARALLRQLQARYAKISSIDEPADSPLSAAYDDLDFREYDRQFVLQTALHKD